MKTGDIMNLIKYFCTKT